MTAKITLVPIRLDWELYAGDYRVVRFRFINQTTGGPQDMSGQHYGQVRLTAADPVVRGQFQFDLTDAAIGIIMVVIPPEMTAGLVSYGGTVLPQWSGGWDWQWEKPGGTYPITLYRGKMVVYGDITRITEPAAARYTPQNVRMAVNY